MRRLSILLALVMLCGLRLGAAEASFRHITSREGLPYTWVRDIYRDSDGYMWFSTIYGAYRYDGRYFEEYSFLGPDGGRRLTVFHVREDSDGNLWFCTESGLFRHDPHTAATDEPLFSGKNVFDLTETADGTLWIGTAGGVFKIRKAEAPEHVSGTEGAVYALITDSANNLWAGTTGAELYRFDAASDSLLPVRLKEPLGAPVYSLMEDSSQNLWISTSGAGVYKYTPRSGALRHWDVAGGGLLNNLARDMAEDRDGTVWVATERGLATFRPDGGQSFILGDPASPKSLNDNAVYAAYRDPAGVLWFGTFFGGVNILSSGDKLFDSYLSSPEEYSGDSKVVSSVVPYGDGLLVGTENDGVFLVDAQSRPVRHFSSGGTGIAGDNVHSICVDAAGNIWVGTYYNGLSFRPHGSSAFKTFTAANSALTVNNIYIVRQDSRGNLWVGTQYGGLYRYDYQTGKLVRFPADFPGGVFVWDIRESRDGNIYLATFGSGLWRLNVEDSYTPERLQTPASFYVCICELQDGRLLLGTEKEGLVEFNPGTSESRRISSREGLPDDAVYGILQDASGDIWMSSNAGLTRCDASLEHFVSYTMSDGLPTNRFNYNAATRIGGTLYFGSTNGVVQVRPELTKTSRADAPVRLNTLYVNEEKVPVGSKILPSRLEDLQRITLRSNQNSLRIRFSDNRYDSPGRKYAYMMKGLKSSWQNIGLRRSIDFLSLRPGKYTLRIAAAGQNGVTGPEANLQIRILPPWWASVPAKIIYLVAFLVAVALLLRSVLRHSGRKHKLAMDKLAREKDEEISEIKKQLLLNESSDGLLIRKVTDYIFAHVSDSMLDVDTLCEAIGVSRASLYRKMKSVTGFSAGEFILNIRLKYAASLLSETDRTISDIAYESGFTDPYYFSRAFKKLYGASPKYWRTANQKQTNN